MSHDTVISALNALSKMVAMEIAVQDHVKHLLNESDRSAIILCASATEDVLEHMIRHRMSSLNSDELSRLFGINGPLGTFSAKTMMAQGLGILNRTMAKRVDIIRAMRNAAAHCVAPVNFETPAIRDAVYQLAPAKERKALVLLPPFYLRAYFTHAQAVMARQIAGADPGADEHESISFVGDLMLKRLETLRDKPEG